MDHLAKQIHIFVRVLFQGAVAYFNGVLHAITKTKVSGQDKLYRAEVQKGRREVLFSQIFYPAGFLNPPSEGRAVISRYLEFFNGCAVLVYNRKGNGIVYFAVILIKKQNPDFVGALLQAAFDSLSSFILFVRISLA